ncbi:MAG TPA: hypothetical protein VNN07_10420 [Candidatus Tectomicrobia bacterium]|nr:hypothetical protein [Candidatus Tectomicrobia bacterium]
MRVAVALLAFTLGPASPAITGPYDIDWTVSARLTRWHDGQTVTTTAERRGRGVARLVRVAPEVLRIDFSGEDGEGQGYVGPAGPTAFVFPPAMPLPGPPALPHLTGGSFELLGPPDHPSGFRVDYVEGFICRATPAVCGGVAMWEQHFAARAARP